MLLMSRWDVIGFPKRLIRNKYIGKASGIVAIVLVGITGAVVGSQEDLVPAIYGGGAPVAQVLMDIYAPRDVGALPDRAGWCTDVRTADHCWLLQETSGNAIDSTGSWDLAPSGSPRRGVLAAVPVENDIAFRQWDERGTFFDGVTANGLKKSSVSVTDGTALISVTFVAAVAYDQRYDPYITIRDPSAPNYGWLIYPTYAGVLAAFIDGPDGIKDAVSLFPARSYELFCATVVMDGREVNAARFYVNGEDSTNPIQRDVKAGSIGGVTGNIALGAFPTPSQTLPGGLYRLRIDDQYKATLADHQSWCGSLWQPPSGGQTGVSSADVTYTQTGGPRCHQTGSASAICAPREHMAYAVYGAESSDLGWAIEPACVNRILYSSEIDCTNWTCSSATVAKSVSPNGAKFAASITATSGQYIEQAVTGYTASSAVDLRLWVKCSSGTPKITNQGSGAAGDWSINCTAIAGVWTLIDDAHPSVTVNTAWQSGTGGAVTLRIQDSSIEVWIPTVTDGSDSCYSVIPTITTAIDVGAIVWSMDNSSADYYSGDQGKITLTGDWYDNECLTIANAGDVFGKSFLAGDDWTLNDSAGTLVSQCSMPLDGEDTGVLRWRSTTPIAGVSYSECVLNGVRQSWDTTPIASWTPASPSAITIDATSAVSCSAVIERIKIEDQP